MVKPERLYCNRIRGDHEQVAALGKVANSGCRNQNKYEDKEERVNGKNDHECAGAIGTDGH